MAPYALNSCPNLFTVYKVLPSGHSVSLIFPQFQREIPNMKLLITLFLAAATILTGSQGQQCVEDDCLGKLCDTDADCATCPGRTAWAMRSSFFIIIFDAPVRKFFTNCSFRRCVLKEGYNMCLQTVCPRVPCTDHSDCTCSERPVWVLAILANYVLKVWLFPISKIFIFANICWTKTLFRGFSGGIKRMLGGSWKQCLRRGVFILKPLLEQLCE